MKQAYVLANLARVRLRPAKIGTTDDRRHFQLDGQDCTQQIVSLIVKKQVFWPVGKQTAQSCLVSSAYGGGNTDMKIKTEEYKPVFVADLHAPVLAET